MGFYDNVHQVISSGAEQAVKPEEAITTLTVIERAMESHLSRQIVSM
jgi:predicted dehydrogenase